MARFDKGRQFEVLTAALAAADERGSVSLAEFAERFDVDLAALRQVVADAVLCEFRTAMGDVVGFTDCFLLTDDDVLVRGHEHWLRDLVSVPPEPDAALRLFMAGTAVRALQSSPEVPLDTALQKLRRVISAEIVIADHRPDWLPLVEQAWHSHRRLLFRYVKDGHSEATDREIEPHLVYSRWTHWYVMGRPVAEDTVKEFRIDRMVTASISDTEFEPPDDVEIPEWFDLSAGEHTVRLRLPKSELVSIPRPHRTGEMVELPDGLVEVDVTVTGDRRLDHLLVALGPECEVIEPTELAARRRSYAAELLTLYA